MKSPSEVLRIKGLIRRGDYAEAVLNSLQVWNAGGKGRPDLLLVLRNLGLNVLAREIGKVPLKNPSISVNLTHFSHYDRGHPGVKS